MLSLERAARGLAAAAFCAALAAAPSIIPSFALLAEPAGDPARGAQLEPEILARVGGSAITASELRAELTRRASRGAAPPREAADLEALLEEMARHRALLAAARAAGYDQRPELLEVWERLVVQAYQRDALEARLASLAVGEDEIAAHYAEHAADYAVPGRRQLAIVRYQVPADAPAATRTAVKERAAAALAEAAGLSARHFGEIARRDSDHRESRYRGGVIGYLLDGAGEGPAGLPPEALAAARRLERPGELAPLLETSDGFYLLRLVEREPPRGRPLEQLAPGIGHQLLRAKREAARAAFESELRRSAGIEIDAARLAALDIPFAQPAPPPSPSAAPSASPGDAP